MVGNRIGESSISSEAEVEEVEEVDESSREIDDVIGQ
jgi:hypothetical protein